MDVSISLSTMSKMKIFFFFKGKNIFSFSFIYLILFQIQMPSEILKCLLDLILLNQTYINICIANISSLNKSEVK